MSSSTRHLTRVAVIQLAYHPAALVDRRSPLEDPLFEFGRHDSLTPAAGPVPEHLLKNWESLRRRIREAYNAQLLLKLQAILATLQRWGVNLAVFPEYSIPFDILGPVADAAGDIAVVAGTHLVTRDALSSHIYERLGMKQPPGGGESVCPVLHQHLLLALQPKMNPAVPEQGSMRRGQRWEPITLPTIPGAKLGVLICLDFLFRDGPQFRELVGDKLEQCRFLAVPALTPHYTGSEFSGQAWEEARRYGRPVLFANGAAGGHSSIFVDQGALADLKRFPQQVGQLDPQNEGVIVADIHLGMEAAGRSTRYDQREAVIPFAAASLVYTSQVVDHDYAQFLAQLPLADDDGDSNIDGLIAQIEQQRELLLRAGANPTGGVRDRRLRQLLQDAKHLFHRDEVHRFLREIVLPPAALPLSALRSALAKGASDVIFAWQRERRAEEMADIEAQLRKQGDYPAGDIWTDEGGGTLTQVVESLHEPNVREPVAKPTGSAVTVQIPKGFNPAALGRLKLADGQEIFLAGSVQELLKHLADPTADDDSSATTEERGLGVRMRGGLFAFATGVGRQIDKYFLESLFDLAVARGAQQIAPFFVAQSGQHPTSGVLFLEGETYQIWSFEGKLPGLSPDSLKVLEQLLGQPIQNRPWTADELSLDQRELVAELFDESKQTIRDFLEERLREVGGQFEEPQVIVDGNNKKKQKALKALDGWMEDHRQTALVLGEFGCGKSTTLARWASKLWERIEKQTARKPKKARTGSSKTTRKSSPKFFLRPLFVNLAGAGSQATAEELLLKAARIEDTAPHRAALRLGIRSGLLLPIFDGFDEMATKLTPDEMGGRLSSLLSVAHDGGRVILSSRSNYFPSEAHFKTAITSALEQALGESSSYLRMEFQLFDERQIKQMVRGVLNGAAATDEALQRIRELYPLQDLVRRPLFLGIVLQTIDRFHPGDRITRADLFEAYLQRWLEQTHTQAALALSDDQKIALAEALAEQLWRSGEASCSVGELLKSVRQALVERPTGTDLALGAVYLAACGGAFFVRDGEDRFRFAHKSFLEFFLARSLIKTIPARCDEALDTKPITQEVASFVGELLRREGVPQGTKPILLLHHWLVSDNYPATDDYARRTAPAAANAIRLLLALARWSGVPEGWVPDEVDLRFVAMPGEDLSQITLRRADLREADFSSCTFRSANLSGAKLTRTRFTNSTWEKADLSRVDAIEADFRLAQVQDSSLQEAQFANCAMGQSTWIDCDAMGASFAGSELTAALVLNCAGFPTPPTVEPASHLAVTLAQEGCSSNSIAVSPDGQILVSGGWDNTIRLWDRQTGALLQTLAGHQGVVTSVACTPDDETFVSGSWDNTIRLWDRRTGALLQTLTGHENWVTSVACTPDGQTIVSGSEDKTIRLWDRQTGALLQTLTGHEDRVTSVACTPDGQAIVSGSEDNTIRLWDRQTGALLLTLTGHESGVNSVACTPEGQAIVSGSYDNTIRLWDRQTGALLQTLTGHEHWVASVACTPDGQAIVSGSWDNTIRLWDRQTGALLQSLTGHEGEVSSVACTPDAQVIVSGSWDNTIRLWDRQTGALLQTLTGFESRMMTVACAPDGQAIVSGSRDNTIRLWDRQTGALLQKLTGHEGGVTSVACTPDGQTIISGSRDKTIRLWDRQTGALLLTLTGHENWVTSVACTPDGQTIVSGSDDCTIRLWDRQTGALLQKLTGHEGGVTSVACTPDGQTIVSGSWDNTIRLWDRQTGALLLTLTGHENWVTSVACTPDSQTILSGSEDNTIRLWDRQTGALLLTLTGHESGVNSVACTPAGQAIVSGSEDNTIRLWDRQTGDLLQTLMGFESRVMSIACTPDSQSILSGGSDQSIRLWDRHNGAEIARWAMLGDGILCQATSGFFAFQGNERQLRFVFANPKSPGSSSYVRLGKLAEVLNSPERTAGALQGTLPPKALADALAKQGLSIPSAWNGERWIVPALVPKPIIVVPEAEPETAPISKIVSPPNLPPSNRVSGVAATAPIRFRPAGAFNNPAELIGREEILTRLHDLASNGISSRLLGPRRSGKTWILAALEGRLKSAGRRVIRKSLQGATPAIRTPDDLAQFLTRDAQRVMLRAADFFHDLESNPAVILLDEIACLADADPHLFVWLRSIGQEASSPLIYSGTPWDWHEVIEQGSKIRGSSFGNDVRLVELQPVNPDEARRFLYAASLNAEFEMPHQTIDWILELVGCWPFYLQVMGFEFIQEIKLGRRGAIVNRQGVYDLYEAGLLTGSGDVFHGRWVALPAPAQELVKRLLSNSGGLKPEIAELTYEERKIIEDTGLASPIHGWLDDKPFTDWIWRRVLAKGASQ